MCIGVYCFVGTGCSYGFGQCFTQTSLLQMCLVEQVCVYTCISTTLACIKLSALFFCRLECNGLMELNRDEVPVYVSMRSRPVQTLLLLSVCISYFFILLENVEINKITCKSVQIEDFY